MSKNSGKKIFNFLLLSIGIIIPYSGICWGLTGHRVVAQIAQDHLTSKARKELKVLLGRESMAALANWPDFIKSDTANTWKYTSAWHYVNMPSGLSKDEFISKLKSIPGENLYTQIQVLQKQVADHSLSIEKRRTALIFLIHLVGDLHQPLHVGREEDLGGNKIKVEWFDRPTNLHKVWDDKLIDFQQYSYTEYSKILDIADKNRVKEIQDSELEDWFYESYVLANKIYTMTPEGSKLSYRYNFLFMNDMNNQLLMGGLRLAKILNQVLK